MRRPATPIDDQDFPRGRKPRKYRDSIDQAERDAEAARLRSAGLSLRQVGQRLGVAHTTASTMIQRALAAVPVDAVGQLRSAEGAMLDELQAELWQTIRCPPKIVSAGKVTDEPDRDVINRAADSIVRVSTRRARLFGLDAPMITVRQAQTTADLDATIRDLIAQKAEQDRANAIAELARQGRLIAGRAETPEGPQEGP